MSAVQSAAAWSKPKRPRNLPAWAKDDGRGFASRLMEILRLGGERKRVILKAWAEWAGLTAQVQFDKSVELMLKRGDLQEYMKPGPRTEDSGPYLALGHKTNGGTA